LEDKQEMLTQTSSNESNQDVENMSNSEAVRRQNIRKNILLDIEIQKQQAILVEKATVYEQLFAFGNEMRNSLLTIPDRIADRVVNASQSRFQVHTIIYDSIADELEKLADIEISQILNEAVAEMYFRIDKHRKGIQPGITTGLAELNLKTTGWQKSDLIILAARPAMGKTAMALHFAKRAAKNGTPVALFSLEMSDVSLANRIILSETEIDPDNFKQGKISNIEAAEIEKAIRTIYNYPIYVDSNSSVSMNYIHAKARVLHKKGKCDLLIIDYLQLAAEKGDKNRNRENEVSAMSREAKLIAKDLDIPVILLSQLNRDVDKRRNKVPVLADLRESGAIEQDADQVIFIHRPEYYSGNAMKGYGELIIAKYRNGNTGIVPFKYNESMTKIFDFDKNNIQELSLFDPNDVPF
jgi:replicative DNA helicase